MHTMVASNELNPTYFIETARILFELVVEISKELDVSFKFVNLGGGIGIPYRPDQEPVPLETVAKGIKEIYDSTITAKKLNSLKVFLDCGRLVTGPYGYLVSRVRYFKHMYKDYVGLDSCMANLMRPGIHGAYHHVTVLGKEKEIAVFKYDVTGSLCGSNDKFAVDRLLPEVKIGDLIVIHDTGAHGHSMGFNYNGKLRSAELLLRENGSVLQIRRAETIDDYFRTLDFKVLKEFK